MNIKAIVFNTFKEAVRNKIFYLLIAFGVFFTISSRIIGMLTVGDQTKIIKDVGLASINFFCVLIAIFTGINLVYKEIEKKTIYSILSKPISRDHFIIGKFLGLALTIFVALTSMVIIFFIFLLIFTSKLDLKILLYFLMLYLELMILISISLLFSSFSTPILSSIFTICLYLIGQILWTFNQFKYLIQDNFTRGIIQFIYLILPNLHKFNIKNELILNLKIPLNQILSSCLYALLYIGAILTLTIIIFRKREFQ